MSGLTENVSAVSPLGDSINGNIPAKPRRPRKPPMRLDSEATWHCIVCGRTTDDPADQARHVAAELFKLTADMAELRVQAGDLAGVIPADASARGVDPRRLLIDTDDLRRAHAAAVKLRRRGEPVSDDLQMLDNEYDRRKQGRHRAARRAAETNNQEAITDGATQNV